MIKRPTREDVITIWADDADVEVCWAPRRRQIDEQLDPPAFPTRVSGQSASRK
jgi:hypothetical protein